MSRIVGIDLGTTNSLVATVDSGIPLVLADAQGRRLTPSVVHFPADGSEPLVGEPARRVLALHPDRTFFSVKRFIGRRGNEISPGDAAVNYGLDLDGTRPARLRLGSGSLLPEEVSAKVLAKLKADAEAALGETIDRAVITVPAYFNDAQRQATLRAADLAGLTVERIINEPTAAALSYGLNRLKERSKVAVYDLGGGTFDLSILELTEGVFQVLATHGDTRLGGDDIDRAIIDWLRAGIRARGGPDLSNDPAAMARLREAAESAKIALSTQDTFRVELPFLSQSFSFDAELGRATLESISSAVVERTREHCLHALKDAKLKAADLDQVILVGGQTRMPLVRRKVAEWFACSDFETVSGNLSFKEEEGAAGGRRGPRLNTGQNPDEAIALGAAIQAEILSGGLRSVLLLDVTPLSLGLETFGGLMNVLIPRNTTIPVKAGEVFTNAVDGQREMMIHVLQGERDRAEHNWSLGRFNLEFEPSPRGVARVGVQFEIDANGVLHVLARDIKTGAERRVPMRSAVDVDDADVQRMVEESVDHAFEDLHARRWIEAKLRSVEAVEATRTALEELHDQLSEELRSQAVRALEAVEQVLALEDPQTRVGDVDALKRAALELDQATQPMADLLIDRAMEEALRQRGLVP